MASRTYTTRSRTQNVRNQSTAEPLRNNGQNQTETERILRYEGFTVIAPNERKRQELNKAIDNDERKLQEHEERKKQSFPRCNYVGSLGGSSVTNPVVSSNLISNPVQNKKTQGTKQDYRAEGRRQENVQIAKMKEHQRQMTKRNEEREKERKEKLDVDRKLKMENFLAGLEKKMSQNPEYDSNERT